MVNVPVLSKTITSTSANASSALPLRIKIPLDAARLREASIEVGTETLKPVPKSSINKEAA